MIIYYSVRCGWFFFFLSDRAQSTRRAMKNKKLIKSCNNVGAIAEIGVQQDESAPILPCNRTPFADADDNNTSAQLVSFSARARFSTNET